MSAMSDFPAEQYETPLSAFLLDVASASSLHASLEALARHLPRLLPDVARASVALPQPSGHLQVVAFQGSSAIPMQVTLPIETTSVGLAFRDRRLRISPHITLPSALGDLQMLGEGGILSCVNVPLLFDGEVFGVMNLGRATPSDWQQERPLLELLAVSVAGQLRLHHQLQGARESLLRSDWLVQALQSITHFGQELSLFETEADILARSGEIMSAFLPHHRASLCMLLPDSQHAELVFLTGVQGPQQSRRIPLAGSRILRCVETRATLITSADMQETYWDVAMLAQLGLRSMLLAPLLAAGQLLGTLNVAHEEADHFGEVEVAIARQLAATITAAILSLRTRTHLEAARRHAEEMTQAKARFLATMAHELRTPLHAVVGMSQLLSETPISEEQRPFVETIRTSGEVLSALIGDVLDFSKIETGELILEPQPVALRPFLQETLDMVRGGLQQRPLTLSLSLDPALPPIFTVDPGRLRQVLLNLLSNAVKFTAQGEISVSAAAWSGGLQIAVGDTGIGIAPEALHTIFEPFRQAEVSTTRRFGGTGLGLAICRQLCQAMGGDIAVSSTVGQGTTFTVQLQGTFTQAPKPTGLAAAAAEPLPALRILLVDDHPVNLTVATAQLRRLGIQPTQAASAAEARRRYAADAYDLVLMDLHMPEEDGLSATRSLLSSAGPHAVFVALTADAVSEIVEVCLAAGFAEVLTKPARLEQLRTVFTQIQPRTAHSSARYGT